MLQAKNRQIVSRDAIFRQQIKPQSEKSRFGDADKAFSDTFLIYVNAFVCA
jgi:hypothetical protein